MWSDSTGTLRTADRVLKRIFVVLAKPLDQCGHIVAHIDILCQNVAVHLGIFPVNEKVIAQDTLPMIHSPGTNVWGKLVVFETQLSRQHVASVRCVRSTVQPVARCFFKLVLQTCKLFLDEIPCLGVFQKVILILLWLNVLPFALNGATHISSKV